MIQKKVYTIQMQHQNIISQTKIAYTLKTTEKIKTIFYHQNVNESDIL